MSRLLFEPHDPAALWKRADAAGLAYSRVDDALIVIGDRGPVGDAEALLRLLKSPEDFCMLMPPPWIRDLGPPARRCWGLVIIAVFTHRLGRIRTVHEDQRPSGADNRPGGAE